MSPQQPPPSEIRVRMYQVGFGDCFLVGFHYDAPVDGRDARHVLFDFGSNRWPEGHKARFPEVADDIAAQTGGVLDALVVTHRHKDHLGGYSNAEAAAKIAALEPKAVVRPWTDDPNAKADAAKPEHLGDHSLAYVRSLDHAQEFADVVASSIGDHERGFRGDLREFAADQVKNKDAIDRLDALADKTANHGDYVYAGSQISLSELLPGVTTTVLGPPTIEMWPQVAGERADDPEYWLRQQALLGQMLAVSGAPPDVADVAAAVDATPAVDPGPIRWIVERLHGQQTHSLLRIVGGLEDALNNTSVILLFKAGQRTLLFPGDAQIENWSYCLTSPDAGKLVAPLEDVDLYKVGHHGSRNATPRALVKKWVGRPTKLTSMMSTKQKTYSGVPRQPLIDALMPLGPLYRTDDLAPELLFQEVRASTADTEPFAPT